MVDLRGLDKYAQFSKHNQLHTFTSRNAEQFLSYRKKLPIWSQKKDIIQKVLQNQVTIVTGETGSGKTTQVPQFILDNSFDNQSPCKIICAEPRRLGMFL